MLIFPDGKEKEIRRRSNPSILEGKNVLKAAVQQGAQAVVAEMMSIRPELTFVESVQFFRPHILVITNARLDHTEQMGTSKEDIAACLASAIPDLCTVFVPEKEFFPVYKEKADRTNSRIFRVSRDAHREKYDRETVELPFTLDVQLTLAVAEFLDIDTSVALAGMKRIRPDFGSLKAWISRRDFLPRRSCFVSAFAANEPESTKLVLDYLKAKGIFSRKRLVALLNFRKDRGDRTFQWCRAMQKGFLSQFDKIALLGEHASVVVKRLKSGFGQPDYIALTDRSPAEITESVVFQDHESVVIGMGNMGGLGKELAQYWETIGEPYDI